MKLAAYASCLLACISGVLVNHMVVPNQQLLIYKFTAPESSYEIIQTLFKGPEIKETKEALHNGYASTFLILWHLVISTKVDGVYLSLPMDSSPLHLFPLINEINVLCLQ